MTARATLRDYAADVFSQNGEDGMIAEILRRLSISHGTCVEFGAHDGHTNSNTARLWRDLRWRAALVEADADRHALLTERIRGRDCVALLRTVTVDGHDRIDRILVDAGYPLDVDVLSIDIDGDDLAILRDLGDLRARVVICEYNPTMPWHIAIEGAPGTATGCSLGALVEAARGSGLEIVGVTATNALFVRSEDAGAFADLETSLAALATAENYCYVVTDYAGRATIVGALPYGFRPGRPRIDISIGRADVALRWTWRGLLRDAKRALRHLVRGRS